MIQRVAPPRHPAARRLPIGLDAPGVALRLRRLSVSALAAIIVLPVVCSLGAGCDGDAEEGPLTPAGGAPPTGGAGGEGAGAAAGGNDGDGGVDADAAVGPSGPIRWAELPEIVFVRGFAEVDQLGPFLLDPGNPWPAGDLENTEGWTSVAALELRTIAGSLTGTSFDSASGALSYDGSGAGSETATMELAIAGSDVTSEPFNVRILSPTVVWGTGADVAYPGIGFDPAAGLSSGWNAVQQATMTDHATYEAPNVWLVLEGDYTHVQDVVEQRIRFASHLDHLYVLGEPGARPVLRDGSLGGDFCYLFYVKNFELVDFNLQESIKYLDAPGAGYFTKLYQHDETGETTGISAPAYEGDNNAVFGESASWRTHIWAFEGAQNGGTGNTTHQFYIEGRPNTALYVNNIRIRGSRGCSIIKSTRKRVKIRNSYLSALYDPADLTAGDRSAMVIDIVSCGEHAIYNNHLVGTWDADRGGPPSGLVSIRARRDWWAADEPAYPDVSYDPPVTSLFGGGYSAPPGFTAGPETFVDPAFWEAVASYALDDPDNPYAFRHFVSHNRFEWIVQEGVRRRSAYRNDGTAPRHAVAQFSAAEIWPKVPHVDGEMIWLERSVGFFANNRYLGWTAEDAADPTGESWFDLSAEGLPDPDYLDPEAAWPPPPREVVVLGGEDGPLGSEAPIELPDWFLR
jgi:hypothetical protein